MFARIRGFHAALIWIVVVLVAAPGLGAVAEGAHARVSAPASTSGHFGTTPVRSEVPADVPRAAALPAAAPTSPTSGGLSTPWTTPPGALDPSARGGLMMAYDAADGYPILFGGGTDTASASPITWIFQAGAWREDVNASHLPGPSARQDGVMAYDAADREIVLFGGAVFDASGTLETTLNDTWTFTNGTWTNATALSPTAPPGRFAAAMAYDSADGELVLSGGNVLTPTVYTPLNDTWTFHAGVWTNVTATAGAAPSGRDFAAFSDDPSDGGDLLYGGWNSSSSTLDSDTWLFSGGTWLTMTTTSSPGPLRGASMAYDAANSSVFLFGGASWGPGGPFAPSASTWMFASGSWANLTLSIPSAPPARFVAGLSTTGTPGNFLLTGGCVAQGCPSSSDLTDSWRYDPSAALGLLWGPVGGSYVQPSARSTDLTAYDPSDGYVLYFGGGGNNFGFNETWTFANGTWTNRTANLTVAPSPRTNAVMVEDDADGYVLLFGGYKPGTTQTYNDTWSYSHGAWTQLHPATAPPPWFTPAAAYDTADREVVLFGGNVLDALYPADFAPVNYTWTFHGGIWTNVSATSGIAPPARDFATMSDDPADGGVVLFGGWDSTSGTIYNDTWWFANGTWSLLHPAVSPEPLRGAQATFESVGGYVLLFGGTTYAGPAWPFGIISDTWMYAADNWTNLTPYLSMSPPGEFSGALTNISTGGTLLLADGCLIQGCPTQSDISDTWLFNWTSVNGSFGFVPAGAPLASSPAGAPYAVTFVTHAWGGTRAYHYAYSGLPSGCAGADSATLPCSTTTPGRYAVSVEVTDSGGHAVLMTINVTLGRPAVVGLVLGLSASAVDLGQSTQLTAVPSGGVGAPWTYSYLGLPPGCTAGDAASVTCTPTAVGTYAVEATVVDAAGNVGAASIELTVHPHVGASVSLAADVVDLGEVITLTASGAGGSASYAYAWSGLPGGCSSVNAASNSCQPTAAGSFSIVAGITDTLGQSADAAVQLTVNPLPQVVASSDLATTGPGTAVQFTALASGGTAPFVFSWTFGDGSTATSSAPRHAYAAAGTYAATVEAVDARGIGEIASVTITVALAPAGGGGPGGGSGPGPSTGSHTAPTAALGTFALGVVVGLLALLGVGAWIGLRRRALAEGEALVAALDRKRRRGGGPAPAGVRAPTEAPPRHR